jgi:hypothetical protein
MDSANAMIGELIIRWSARIAVGCYISRLVCDFGRPLGTPSQESARWWWTMGCLSFVLHVIAAFHFEHHWSHAAAYEATSRRTAEMTGWNSGLGLYINEAFLVLWMSDTFFWWRDLYWPRHRRIYWSIQSVFAFLMLQATAIFGPPFWIPVVAVVILFLSLRGFGVKSKS